MPLNPDPSTTRSLLITAMGGFWMLLAVPHALSWVIPQPSHNV